MNTKKNWLNLIARFMKCKMIEADFLIRLCFFGGGFDPKHPGWIPIPKESIDIKPMSPPSEKIWFIETEND